MSPYAFRRVSPNGNIGYPLSLGATLAGRDTRPRPLILHGPMGLTTDLRRRSDEGLFVKVLRRKKTTNRRTGLCAA